MRSLTFNGHNCNEFGIAISGEASFNAPRRDRTVLSIPGRNGAYIIDNGRYDSITVEYPAFFFGNFASKAAEVREWLLAQSDYARLEDDYHTDEFRMGIFSGDLEFTPTAWNQHARFTLSFLCKPQRFLKTGETTVTVPSGGTITNPTGFTAKPLVTVRASAAPNGSVTINGTTMTFSRPPFYAVALDCEEMEAYNGTTLLNEYVGGDYPVLSPGTNTVSFSGNITTVEIKPRWWRL